MERRTLPSSVDKTSSKTLDTPNGLRSAIYFMSYMDDWKSISVVGTSDASSTDHVHNPLAAYLDVSKA